MGVAVLEWLGANGLVLEGWGVAVWACMGGVVLVWATLGLAVMVWNVGASSGVYRHGMPVMEGVCNGKND